MALSPEGTRDSSARPWQLLLAFAIVYIVWGSTYLAIRFAVETMPPLLMAGTRFLAAGGLLYAWHAARARRSAGTIAGAHGATRAQWRSAAVTGLFLISAAYGLVTWAELTVPSGIVALVTAMTPLWMVVIPWFARREHRPPPLVLAGIAIGLVAQALLFGLGDVDHSAIDPWGMSAVVLAGIAWAMGSLRARDDGLPADPILGSAMQMLTGGLVLVIAGLLFGEAAHFSLERVTLRSWLAWGYLVVAGSMVAYSAYLFLLKSTSAARASTYAYVNPIVAVALGWLLAGEPIGWRTVIAMGLTLVAVVAINRGAEERGVADSTSRASTGDSRPASAAPAYDSRER
jgi:drug/metabolite transporter (DMT)-like permease